MKKKIGISYTEVNFKNYWNWFSYKEQNEFELIELSFLKNNEGDIARCDGFILTGGIDVDPFLYGGSQNYANMPTAFETSRDRFEEKIYNYSQHNKKPLLGICRGLQLVNVLQGGRLIQDLSKSGNAIHRREKGADKLHDITIEKGTLLGNLAASATGRVNSAHHQAIDPGALGDNLIVNSHADCEKKVIEGVEFKNKNDKAFMLCVQWHPERMEDKKSVFSDGIKKSFLTAIRNTI